jgi:PAS domain S-box-containing protein
MDRLGFEQRVEAERLRVDALCQRIHELPVPDRELLQEAIEELQTTLEELRVANEELRQQNDELTAAQQVIEAERHRYQELFDLAPDGYLVTDAAGTIREANRAAAKLLNIAPEHLPGKPLPVFVPTAERRAFRSLLTRLRRAERVPEWEVRLRPRRAAPIDAAVTVTAVRDRRGELAALRWLLRDVSERKQAEERQQRLERDLGHERRIVQTLTANFLGKIPQIPGLQVAASYQPASESDHVGGDYFDFIRLDEHRMGVVIGDVCGSGLSAALYTAAVKHMLRAYAWEEPEPQAVILRLNRALEGELREEATFVSLVYGVVELDEASAFTYVNGGHPPAVLYDPASQQCLYLERTGPIVGAFADSNYRQRTLPLVPGAILVLYTDGVSEAAGCPDALGEEGICETLQAHRAEGVERIAEALLTQARVRVGGDLGDDAAIVVVRRT